MLPLEEEEEMALLEHLPSASELLAIYDGRFFRGDLRASGCKVEWSDRMTLCAGMCYLKRPVLIRLSRPLLGLRPFSETIDTLMHEMIHAVLFLRGERSGRDGHGPPFLHLMERINRAEGTSISVHHRLYREVREQRKHKWRCTGPCRLRPPHYGWVERAMRRAPQPADWWFPQHQLSCGGNFVYAPWQRCQKCGREGHWDWEHIRRCNPMARVVIELDD
jgi:predicted SprT family Zn-dependent metalloprotease